MQVERSVVDDDRRVRQPHTEHAEQHEVGHTQAPGASEFDGSSWRAGELPADEVVHDLRHQRPNIGDELEIRLNVGPIGRSSFTLVYEIAQAENSRLVASGTTVMVSYDYAASQPVALPAATRELLQRVRR